MMGVSFGEVALCLMTTLKVRCFDLSLKDAFLVRWKLNILNLMIGISIGEKFTLNDLHDGRRLWGGNDLRELFENFISRGWLKNERKGE